jgi:hypothetical protein
MYPSRTPITDANIRAHEAAMAGRLVDENPKPERRKDARPGRAAAIVDAMAMAMREIGEGCTDKDLKRAGFSQTDIDRYGEQASDRAARRALLN